METIKTILQSIGDQILDKNKFFANGFTDTFLHEEKGLLLSNDQNEYLNITDVKGNYFYIGHKPKANVSLGMAVSDCGRSYNFGYDCFLVAITEGMDELILLNSIINSIGARLQTIVSVSTNIPFILTEELKPLNAAMVNSTIAKMTGRQAVKITFTQKVHFQSQSCPIDPADCGCGEDEIYIPGADPCCVPAGGTAGQVLTIAVDGVTRVWADPTGGGGGGGSTVVVIVNSNYNALAAANTTYILFVTAAAVITLPTAVGNTCRYLVKKQAATGVAASVIFTAGQSADGSTTINLIKQYEALEFIPDNSNYGIF